MFSNLGDRDTFLNQFSHPVFHIKNELSSLATNEIITARYSVQMYEHSLCFWVSQSIGKDKQVKDASAEK